MSKNLSTIIKELETIGVIPTEYDEPYKIPSEFGLSIKDHTGNPVSVHSIVKKQDFKVIISTASGRVITCASRHRLVTDNNKSVLALLLDHGDTILTSTGLDTVVETKLVGTVSDFYDLVINSPEMLYQTADGVIHHNTYTIEKILQEYGKSDGNGYMMIKGSGSAGQLYKLLFKNRHENDILFIDDADGMLGDQDQRNLLKAATDTKAVRTIAWMKQTPGIYDPKSIKGRAIEKAMVDLGIMDPSEVYKGAVAQMSESEDYEDDFEDEDSEGKADGKAKKEKKVPDIGDPMTSAPNKFVYKGKVIVISNLPMNKLDPDGALRTRGLAIALDPTREELVSYIKKLAKVVNPSTGVATEAQRDLVVEAITGSTRVSGLSIRTLVRALEIATTMDGDPEDTIIKMIKRYA